jgi:hypothetical protein
MAKNYSDHEAGNIIFPSVKNLTLLSYRLKSFIIDPDIINQASDIIIAYKILVNCSRKKREQIIKQIKEEI